MLHYSLYENKLKNANPGDMLARPTDVEQNTRADLIRDITGPGSILKPTESDAVIDNYWHGIMGYLSRGESYSDDYISIRFSISGDFKGDEDEFDPNRHKLNFNSLLTSTVTQVASEVELCKVEARPVVPVIESVYDWGSKTTDERLTSGDVLDIDGEHLKIHDNLEEEEGVFFVSQAGDSEVRATELHTNKPGTLTIRVPEKLTPGLWRLEVRNTRYGRNTLRTGIFIPVLKVG